MRGAAAAPAWIRGPRADIAVALSWIPFALAAHVVAHDRSALNALLAAVLLFSFCHQPLTLLLVYGDRRQLASRRALFSWSPVVLAGAVMVGMHVSFALVAVVAGLWNAEHTLMQRYGIARIYGRKAGDDNGGVDRALLVSWLVLALVWAAADRRTPALVSRLDLGAVNDSAVATLQSLRPVALALLAPVAVAVVVTGGRWLRAHRAGVGPAKALYVGSTALLFAVMLVEPVAGFVAYVGAHAVEYFAIVHHALGSRSAAGDDAVVVRATRTRAGRGGLLLAYVGAVLAVVTALRASGSDTLYSTVFLTLGGLHLWYDAFIWKLRRPAVGRAFHIPAPVSVGS